MVMLVSVVWLIVLEKKVKCLIIIRVLRLLSIGLISRLVRSVLMMKL